MRAQWDAFNRRGLDSFLALMDDDVESLPRAVSMEGSYHGHDGLRDWWKSILDVLPDYNVEVLQARDLGDHLNVAEVRTRGHGAGSEAPVDETVWQLSRWRRGKCVWWRVFNSLDEALEAAGPH